MNNKNFFSITALLISLISTSAFAGLYEELQKDELYWIPPTTKNFNQTIFMKGF